MGLNAKAYSKLGKKVSDEVGEADYDNHARIWVNSDYPERANGIETGYYEYEEEAAAIDLSYGGYNAFREELAKLAGYEAKERETGFPPRKTLRYDMGAWSATSGPFWELICFSDCEGVLGTEVCQRLAKDFEVFQAKAEEFGDNPFFIEVYNKLRAAVELAANGGAIQFA